MPLPAARVGVLLPVWATMGVLLPVWALGMVAGILLSPACIFGYLLTGRVRIGCSQTTWFFVFIIAILLFCIIVLGDFQYAGYKWAYIALGALDLVLGLLLLWRILGRQERIEGGEDEDDEEKGEKGEAELKPIL